jgi:heme/copper-type cytochrome/quinol oxidase subunit 3
VLFIAGMIGFLIVRFTSPNLPAAGWISLPSGLWASTAVLLAAGWAMHRAAWAAAAKDSVRMARRLLLALALSILFVLIQIPCLAVMLRRHAEESGRAIGLFGLVATFVVIHAAHVLGGLVALGRIGWRLHRGRLTAADLPAVRGCCWYWHFLEIVWLAMYGTFLAAG